MGIPPISVIKNQADKMYEDQRDPDISDINNEGSHSLAPPMCGLRRNHFESSHIEPLC